GSSGAIAGDTLDLLIGGSAFGVTPQTHVLTVPEVAAGSYTFTVPSGADAGWADATTPSLTATVNAGLASLPLNLTIDTSAPTATNAPTAAVGLIINSAEKTAGVSVVVGLGTSGAVAGDTLDLLINGAPFANILQTHVLTGPEVIAGTYTFTVPSGADVGAWVDTATPGLTARVTDIAGNPGTASVALGLSIDTTAPTAPNAPTAVAGPIINSGEYAAGVAVVVGLGTSGAVAGDTLDLLVNGAAFANISQTHVLTGLEVIAGTYTFTVPSGADAVAWVNTATPALTARVIDIAGNSGSESSALNLTIDTAATPNAPTAVAGPYINSAEYSAGVAVVVGLGTSGAVAGDTLDLLIGGVAFATIPQTHILTVPEVAAGTYTFTVPSGADVGSWIDGSTPSLTATVNAGTASPALGLTIDTSAPTATNAPTAAAGPIIDSAEYIAGVAVDVGLGTSGAVAGDTLDLLIGGVAFATIPQTHILTVPEVAAGTYTFTVPSGADAVAWVDAATPSLTAIVTDVAANPGVAGPALGLTIASSDATVTSITYIVSTIGGGAETITNVPFGTSKATFESKLTKGELHQIWNDAGISDPVVTGDTLIVTAEDTVIVITYTVTVNAAGGGGHTLIYPSAYSVAINSGASATSSLSVTLNLQSLNAAQVVVSDNPDFIGAIWQSFTNPMDMPWTF
ncbi:MAG: hypothetical protein NTX82_04235, partial [Candidatus Parcubacteria bacterium]|nr:hypothetical protein [Candidatus Parcubacteria bacterium]